MGCSVVSARDRVLNLWFSNYKVVDAGCKSNAALVENRNVYCYERAATGFESF